MMLKAVKFIPKFVPVEFAKGFCGGIGTMTAMVVFKMGTSIVEEVKKTKKEQVEEPEITNNVETKKRTRMHRKFKVVRPNRRAYVN